ncbi:GAF domain-containing protein [Chelativorans sp. M5D2P16]|uniref:GAF domain-containing protein n=1 Tax=Chelativorans sp. M5D2P16 TaxID=3095678 RepID=UPI002ACA7836|nr:GAF domain-containing protein [Chelativorans sp. M5D2P16]MDZ5695985.1 GAF domain-containing protein [Chelativorans sp. M5D2P16]
MTQVNRPLAAFDHALSLAKAPQAPFDALYALAQTLVGVKLFTFLTVESENGVARRTYTSDPERYPVTETRPFRDNRWYEQVHKHRQMFVANKLADLVPIFRDYAQIGALGCGSVINLPVVIGDSLVGTVNMLHGEDHFTPERQELVKHYLAIPAKAAYLANRYLSEE